jgi:transcriptional regulator with XRE-family HTH domain
MSLARTKPVRRRKLRLAELESHESLLAKDLKNDLRFRAEWKKSAFARAVALKILQYRAAKRLTQDQLAAKLGLRQSAVARLELGEVTPSFATLVKIAERLNMELLIDIKPSRLRSKLVSDAAERSGVKISTADGGRVLVAATT